MVAPPVFGGWGYGWSPFAPVVSVGFGGFGTIFFFFELFAGLFAFLWVWSFIQGIFNRR